MRELEFKNLVDDLQAKKGSWDALKVPEEVSAELEDLRMLKPSKIQNASIPIIMGSSDNFLFQAKNGSGKTLSFGIPSIMKIDQSNPACQVLIIANTRELIR
jgi:ATP-dependent RNA helicase DDX19/DBP5